MNEHELADSSITPLIKELTKRLNRDILLGSQLGQLIHYSAAACGFAFTPKSFGGLRAFSERYLQGIVERDKTTEALDDVYKVLAPVSDPPDALPPAWERVSGGDPTFWQCYSNPTRAGRFALDEAQQLWLIKALLPVPDEWKQLERMTASDYFAMAKTYIASLPRQNAHFPPLDIENLDPESFYPKWYAMLRKSPDKEATKKWEIHRVQKVVDKLIQRLVATGMLESSAISYGAMLRNSQVSALSQREQRVSVAQSVPETDRVKVDYLREIITKVTRELTVEQMRQLTLPLGIVIDVISQSESSKGTRK